MKYTLARKSTVQQFIEQNTFNSMMKDVLSLITDLVHLILRSVMTRSAAPTSNIVSRTVQKLFHHRLKPCVVILPSFWKRKQITWLLQGNIIMENEKILERWAEYISELYHDERGDKPPIMKNFDGPPIMKDEVRKAVKLMKNGKTAGPDKITVEMIESLDEFGMDNIMLTDFLNAIYDSGEIPSDLSKSIFIALPKKPGATECESHHTISLMSHITKILLNILMARMRNKITPEIAEEQFGFVKDKGTTNAIYMIITLTERAIEIQKDLYLCFIDYTEAFDKLRHEEIMSILDSLTLMVKIIIIIIVFFIATTHGWAYLDALHNTDIQLNSRLVKTQHIIPDSHNYYKN